MLKPLIVGDASDSHVAAVVQSLAEYGAQPVVLNAPKLQMSSYSVGLDSLSLGGQTVDFERDRGWLRRYAPDAWGQGDVIGSLEAVERHAFLRLTGSISRLVSQWLTRLDALLAAEDRLHQIVTARKLGISTPQTLVTNDPNRAHEELGPSFVAKPMAGGWYRSETGEPRAVFAQELDETQSAHLDFSSAPFLLQRFVPADRHLRVVTVQEMGWAAQLDAKDRPLDWRADVGAHSEWEATSNYHEVIAQAVAIANELHAGFTSQDWVVSGDDNIFLDLNPAGQWLFLPEEISGPISLEIARYLAGNE